MVCHCPSAAGTEMPLTCKSYFFRQIKRQLDGRNQWFRITKVRTEMEMNPMERKIMFSTKICSFEDLFTRHPEFAAMMTRLCMDVMGVNADARKEAKPKIYVTLRE